MTAEDGSADPETAPVPVAPAAAGEPVTGAADEATHGVDDILGREVALVTLRPVSGEALENRVDRIRRLARLHHPHLVEVYDVDGLDDDAEHVLVLESVGGRPLDELAAAAPLPLGRVAEIGARIASALAQAHRHGVVHGRLGPASVLVEDDQRVWLVGLTASLQDEADGRAPGAGVDADTVATDGVDEPTRAADPTRPDPTRADDLRALAATLAAAVAPRGAAELERALGEARHGGGSADELSGRLVRLARRDAVPTDTTGAVYAPAAGSTGSTGTAGSGGMRRLTARALAGTGAVAAGAAGAAAGARGAAPAGNAPPSGGTAGAGAVTDRPGRTFVGGTRVATLAAVALLLVLTSGVVIWGQEARGWFGAAQSEPEAAAPTAPPAPAPPPLPVTVPGSSSRSRSSDSGSSSSSDSGRSSRSDRGDDPSSGPSSPAPAPGPVAPVPPPATGPTAPTAPPTTAPPTTAPPTTTPPTTPPTTTPPTTPPSTEPSTPSSGGSKAPDTTSPAPSSTAPGSTDGTDGSDGEQGASPRTRTADPDAGDRA